MPIRQCSNGKWHIGKGPCVYDSKEKALRVFRGLLAKGIIKAESDEGPFIEELFDEIDWYWYESSKSLMGAGLVGDPERDMFTQAFVSVGGFDKTAYRASLSGYQKLRKGFELQIQDIVQAVGEGGLSIKTAAERFKDFGTDAYQQAFRYGGMRTGNPYYKDMGLTTVDMKFGVTAQQAEQRYLQRFLANIQVGTSTQRKQEAVFSSLSASVRAQEYAKSLDAQFWNGYVACAPEQQLIHWQLGHPISDHCDDCIELNAGSPYTRSTLPTVPRAGDTVCLSRCYCSLAYVNPGFGTEQPGGFGGFGAAPETGVSRTGLESSSCLVATEEGGPVSSDVVRLFSDLFDEMNLLRAKMSLSSGDELAQYAASRKLVNAEIIQLQQSYNVRAVPRWSSGDVVKRAEALRNRGLELVREVWKCPIGWGEAVIEEGGPGSGQHHNKPGRWGNRTALIFYHSTTAEAVNSIKKNGIVPGGVPGGFGQRNFPDYYYTGERANSVFMCSTLFDAKSWGKVIGDELRMKFSLREQPKIIVFEVRVPKKTEMIADIHAPKGSYYVKGRIPPSWIAAVHKGDYETEEALAKGDESIFYVPLIFVLSPMSGEKAVIGEGGPGSGEHHNKPGRWGADSRMGVMGVAGASPDKIKNLLASKGFLFNTIEKKGEIYIAHKEFFLSHGGSSEKEALKIQRAIPGAKIIDHGERWSTFRRPGRPLTQKQSHWWVKFTLPAKKAESLEEERESHMAKLMPGLRFLKSKILLEQFRAKGPCIRLGMVVWECVGVNIRVGTVTKIEGNMVTIKRPQGTFMTTPADSVLLTEPTPAEQLPLTFENAKVVRETPIARGGLNESITVELEDGSRGIYKPIKGEDPTWGGRLDLFDESTDAARRETFSYELDKRLGYNIVPETALKEGSRGAGSVQKHLGAEAMTLEEWKHMSAMGAIPDLTVEAKLQLKKIALFDMLIGNTDRHIANVLLTKAREGQARLWAIDNGYSMALRNVSDAYQSLPFELVRGEPIPRELLARVERLVERRKEINTLAKKCGIEDSAMKHFWARVKNILKSKRFDYHVFDSWWTGT